MNTTMGIEWILDHVAVTVCMTMLFLCTLLLIYIAKRPTHAIDIESLSVTKETIASRDYETHEFVTRDGNKSHFSIFAQQ